MRQNKEIVAGILLQLFWFFKSELTSWKLFPFWHEGNNFEQNADFYNFNHQAWSFNYSHAHSAN